MKPLFQPGMRPARGFTLIEIAIVLAISALLLAAGIGITVAVLENARARATKQNMESIRLSLQSFIARNGRLPCPAVETLGPASPMHGIEAATPGTCTGTVDLPAVTPVAKRGVVPWKTLGLTLETASDGWFSQVTYLVTVSATITNFDTVAGMRGSLYVHSATPVVAGLPPTGNQLNACSATANDNICNKAAAAILVSHGRNRYGGYSSGGVRVPTADAGAAELENANNDRFVVSMESGQAYDDIVVPLMPDDLLASLSAQGAVKNERTVILERSRQLAALLQALSTGTKDCPPGPSNNCPSPTSHFYTITAGTGVLNTPTPALDAGKFGGDCPATPQVRDLPLPPFPSLLDPWGNPLKYGVAVASINRDTTCPNPVVFVSMGPNGVLGGGDDVAVYSSIADWKEVFGKTGW